VDALEFMTSWTFMLIMLGLLCFLILMVPLGIVLLVLFLRRANRDASQQGQC
jgi:hypothetical protein